MEEKIYKKIMVILFIIVIFGSFIAFVFIKDKQFSELENRELQQFPSISLDAIRSGDFSKSFSSYISDQFIFRDRFVKLKGNMDALLGKNEQGDIYCGKDGYLIQDFEAPANDVLKDRITALNSFFGTLKGMGKYVMIAPTSIQILQDKLPKYVTKGTELKTMNLIKKDLNKDISFVDVSNILNKNKNKYIYYKTDHHWTSNGAYYAYTEFCKALKLKPVDLKSLQKMQVTDNFYGTLYAKSAFRSVKPDSIDVYLPKDKQNEKLIVDFGDENKKATSLYDSKWLDEKDKYQVFLGGNHAEIDIKTTSKSNKTLLIIKDSYANSFIPFLIPHFKEIRVIDLRYYRGEIKKLTEDNQITDVLFLYNVKTFFEDYSISNLKF
jgi:hypothetical protein